MLVEDDKSLREIYGVRLLAEGYDIVSAGDGEEALAMAIKERPQLIVSDVMMPKISGFDMLDILRSTTETRNIKVIMMTALSSEEQRQRGEQLGADRYLVKSQVGIEDVVRVVHEVLEDLPKPEAAPAPAPQPQAPVATPAAPPVTPQQPAPGVVPAPQTPAPAPVVTPPAPQPQQAATPAPAPITTPAPQHSSTTPAAPSTRSRIIQPLNDPRTSGVNINELLDKELAKEAGVDMDARPTVETADQEKERINSQLNQFTDTLPTNNAAALESIPTVNVSNDGALTNGLTPQTSVMPTPTPVASVTADASAPQSTMPTAPPPPPVPPEAPGAQNTTTPTV